MANTVVSKSVGIQGSSQGNRVVYHVDTAETLDSDDFTFTYQIKNIYGPDQSPASDSDESDMSQINEDLEEEEFSISDDKKIDIDIENKENENLSLIHI